METGKIKIFNVPWKVAKSSNGVEQLAGGYKSWLVCSIH
jgi:hypothetical protein